MCNIVTGLHKRLENGCINISPPYSKSGKEKGGFHEIPTNMHAILLKI